MKRTSPDEWARNNRVYPPSAGKPGPRDPNYTPYVVDVGRAFDDIRYERVIFVCGTQMGKSEIFLDVIGARLDQRPVNILYAGPSEKWLNQEITPRIEALLKGTNSLNRKWLKGKQNKKDQKVVSGVQLRLGWAGSATMLKGFSAGLSLLDELDGMPANVAGEGSALGLVDARGQTFADGKIGATSSPTTGQAETYRCPESGLHFWKRMPPDEIQSQIWRQWQLGTMHHFVIPCTNCGNYFVPRFERLKWPEGATAAEARREAHLLCPDPDCGGWMTNEDKNRALKRATYVAPGQVIDRNGVKSGEPIDTTTASFWVSGLNNPFQHIGKRASDWINANDSGEFGERQTVINTKFGELFALSGGDAPKWREVEAMKKPYKTGEVPDWVQFVTGGIDVQGDCLYYVVRGWGYKAKSALLDFGKLFGKTRDDEGLIGPVWDDCEELLTQPYDGLPIKMGFIDSGDGNVTQRVYQFCRDHKKNARACKGSDKLSTHLKNSTVDITATGKKLKIGSTELWHFNASYFKDLVHERVNMGPAAKICWWLPENITEDYCRQIVAEVKLTNKSGRTVWKKVKADNHYLDCESMAAAAAWMLGAPRLGKFSRAEYMKENKHKRRSVKDFAEALNG